MTILLAKTSTNKEAEGQSIPGPIPMLLHRLIMAPFPFQKQLRPADGIL